MDKGVNSQGDSKQGIFEPKIAVFSQFWQFKCRKTWQELLLPAEPQLKLFVSLVDVMVAVLLPAASLMDVESPGDV